MITNNYGLPPELYDALTKNRYVKDAADSDLTTDFSVSALIAPTRQTILKQRYPGIAEQDAMDFIWLLFGNMMHLLLEEHSSEGSITERRLYKTILGKVISGAIDHYKDRIISDYKSCKAYKIIKQSFDDWQNQLNLYADLYEEAGLPVDSLRIIAIIKDWNKNEIKRIKGYPTTPIVIIPLLKWSKEARERYMLSRVRALVNAEKLADDDLPFCTEEEIWSRFMEFNVLKVGNKVGRNFKTKEEALVYLEGKDVKDYVIKRRMSPPRRCLEYCSASTCCNQFKKWKEENNYGTESDSGQGATDGQEC